MANATVTSRSGSGFHLDELAAAGFRPEAELLLRCARARPANENRIRALLADHLDWAFFVRTAARHRVLALACSNLERTAPDRVPHAVMRELRGHTAANAVRSLSMTRELLGVLDALKAAGIESVPFKGPFLALAAHGDLSLRQFGDLDILVRPADMVRAHRVLESRGYRDERSPHDHDLAPSLRSAYHLKLVQPDTGIHVELHWAFAPDAFGFRLDDEPFWERLAVQRVGSAAISIFAPEDYFLVLAVHGAKHQWRRLDWITSTVDYLDATPELDPALVRRRARRLGIQRIVRLAVWFASALYGLPVAGELSERAKADTAVRDLGRCVLNRLFVDGEPRPGEHHAFYLRMREQAGDRWRYFTHIGMMPNARDRTAVALPGFLAFLHHLTRPLRLLKSYRWRPVRQMLAGLWRS